MIDLRTLTTAWKAVVGFVAPGAVILASAVLSGSDGGSRITTAELVTALVACVVTSAGVYRVSNAPQDDPEGQAGTHDAAAVSPD